MPSFGPSRRRVLVVAVGLLTAACGTDATSQATTAPAQSSSPPATATTAAAASAAPAADPTLVAYWKFDEGSGATAVDSSGLGRTAAFHVPGWSAGHSGSAAALNGASSYLSTDFAGVSGGG